jgi:hypothetical protein
VIRNLSTKGVISGLLAAQIGIAGVLAGGDLLRALPKIALPSSQPDFDRPTSPGDQTRRYTPSDMPLRPSREGNPERPYQSTGDMPERLQFDITGDTLRLTGAIEAGDADRLADFLTGPNAPKGAATVTQAALNSPGGSVYDALEIGRAIRAMGFNTRMEAEDICLSACPYILAGGVARQVHPDAQVGMHQHYFGANTVLPAFLAVEDIQHGQGEVMVYLEEMGVDLRVMQHALLTPPDEIYVLLTEQLLDYALATEMLE